MNRKILFASIILACSAQIIAPQPAYGEIDTASVVEWASKNQNILRGSVVRSLTRASAYTNILPGGTFDAGVSDTQRISIQERAVLNQSLVRPTFESDLDVCGETGEAAELGVKEYSFALGTNRGKGPLVCVKGMYSAFKTSYLASEEALKKQLIQLNNADIRALLVDRCGCKLVVNSTKSFESMFNGEVQAIDTKFANFLPNAVVTFKLIEYLHELMTEDLLVAPWEQETFRFIGGQNIISQLRDQADVKQNHQYMAAGSFKMGKDALAMYRWEGPYRGVAFGVDPQPLRYDSIDGDGNPIFIEPEIGVDADNDGKAARTNPLWRRAKYEIAFLLGRDSFTKLVPESYTGEGSFKFPAQMTTGQLKFKVIEDNDKNVWSDFGRHYYQFTRAYRPERPHAVCAIAFNRNQVDFGLSPITDNGDWSSTAAL